MAVFFRFFKIGEWFTFNFDEEYQALLAWEQVKNFHPIWIGVSASNVGFYLGPGFVYLNALLLKISRDPLILAYFGSAFGIITTLSVFWITKTLFDRQTAVYGALFYSASVFIAYFDRRFWNATPIAFATVWLYYGLMRLSRNPRWLIIVALLLGLSLHIHLSLLVFWPVTLLTIWINRQKIAITHYLMAVLSYLLAVSPLIVFDLTHNFDNLTMPFRFAGKFLASNQGTGNVLRNLPAFSKVISNFFFLKLNTNIQDEFGLGIHGNASPAYPLLVILGIVIISWLIFRAFSDRRYRLLVLIQILFMAAFLTYSAGTVQYFLLGFIALFTINVGIFLSRLPKIIAVGITMIFITANGLVLLTTTQTQYGLLTRKKIIKQMYPYFENKTFYLTTLSPDKRPYHSSGGWRYLFKAYGKTPSASHADQFFGWIYPDEISSVKPELNVVISEYPAQSLPGRPLKTFQSGVYYGYIIKNR